MSQSESRQDLYDTNEVVRAWIEELLTTIENVRAEKRFQTERKEECSKKLSERARYIQRLEGFALSMAMQGGIDLKDARKTLRELEEDKFGNLPGINLDEQNKSHRSNELPGAKGD